MNEIKLKRAIASLYVMIALKIVTSVYSLSLVMKVADINNLMAGEYSFSVFGGIFLTLITSIISVITAGALKEQKLWAWLSAISLFIISLASLAFPASIIGLLSLLDEEVRTKFVKELDIKI